ncbi:MAG: hypothetical protein P0Y64_17280 [Candidatus Sphingomonas colombiensis]|nr:hypothetical protein [Sphingomonas sp.]WEK43065.1 MAG: hypothetical protein P0Y64_17280 [Sphingomonas sp.]
MLACCASFVAVAPAIAANQPANTGLLAYLAARADDGNGDGAEAVRRYAAALADTPGNADVALRAYREALAVGDDALTDRAIATLLAADQAPPDAALISLASAAHARDFKAADAAIARLSSGQLAVLVTPLRAWAAQERGGDPLAILAQRPRDSVSRRLNDETRALILIARGQYDEGSDQPSRDIGQ